MSITVERETHQQAIHDQKLAVHTELDRDEEGERRLRGWVACPDRGPIDLDRCTACSRCRGVLLDPHLNAPQVLCTLGAHREAVIAPADTAHAWIDRPALGVSPDTEVSDVGALMLAYGTEALLVVTTRGEPLGVVHARDVLTAMLAGDAARTTTACMRPLEDVVTSDTSMVDASDRMRQRGAQVLPLADATGHIVGMLTRADVLRWTLRDHPSAA